MLNKPRWISQTHRGMYVHAVAFEVTRPRQGTSLPGTKWGYLVAVRQTPRFDDELVYGPATDQQDYFTREAAEQAAIHYGKQAIDVLLELG